MGDGWDFMERARRAAYEARNGVKPPPGFSPPPYVPPGVDAPQGAIPPADFLQIEHHGSPFAVGQLVQYEGEAWLVWACHASHEGPLGTWTVCCRRPDGT